MTVAILTAVLLSAPLSPEACKPQVLHRVKPMMSTYVSITGRGCDAATVEEAIRAAFAEMERLAGLLSEWDPASPVSRVSAQAGRAPVEVPPEVFEVLEVSQATSALTNGAFDATWAALADLWRFEGPPALPGRSRVAERLGLVDYRELALDPLARTAFLRHAGMRIGLGGLAKGYIAAAGADVMVARGVRDALVAASGDVTARGMDGPEPWRVAIEDPRHPSHAIATVELHDQSISTAGDYQRCFVVDGRRYHHILDPRTGYPAQGMESVSVISDSGVRSDALDTGLFVMGMQRGIALAGKLPGVGALFVDEAGNIETAGSLASRFEVGRTKAPARIDETFR